MRVWDLDPKYLCDNHLLGEHRELHAVWSVITNHKAGYSKHPETLRWVGRLKALYNRHETEVLEMQKRGFKHNSPLDRKLATGSGNQDKFINTLSEQKEILKNKPCLCMGKDLR